MCSLSGYDVNGGEINRLRVVYKETIGTKNRAINIARPQLQTHLSNSGIRICSTQDRTIHFTIPTQVHFPDTRRAQRPSKEKLKAHKSKLLCDP
jgi:hypothetical protein